MCSLTRNNYSFLFSFFRCLKLLGSSFYYLNDPVGPGLWIRSHWSDTNISFDRGMRWGPYSECLMPTQWLEFKLLNSQHDEKALQVIKILSRCIHVPVHRVLFNEHFLGRLNRQMVVKITIINRMVNIVCWSLDNQGREVSFKRFSNYWPAIPVYLIQQLGPGTVQGSGVTEMRKTDLVGKTGKGPGKYVREEGLGNQALGKLYVKSPSGVSPSLGLTFHGNTEGRSYSCREREGEPRSGEVSRGGAISNGLWKRKRFEPVDKRTGRQRERDQFVNSLRYGGPHI